MNQGGKEKYCAHLCVFKSIRLLKKFFQLKTDTFFPASKLLKAVLYHQPPLDLIQSILYIDPYASHPRIYSTTNIETTALQIAIQNDASIAVIEELIKANPYTLFIRNSKFDPITCAQILRSDDKELMESLHRAAKLWDIFGTDEDELFLNQLSEETNTCNSRTIDFEETRFLNEEERDSCIDRDLSGFSRYNDYDYPQRESDVLKTSSNTFMQPRILPDFESKKKGEETVKFLTFLRDIPLFQQKVTVQAMEHINRSIPSNLKETSREKKSNSMRREQDLNLLQSQARSFVLSKSSVDCGNKINSRFFRSSNSDSALAIPAKDSISFHV